jgi:DNA topoisomerase VI subunit A
MNNIESDKTEEQEKFRKLIHDIRNMLKLTDEDIAYIETLNDKQKMEVIIEYDKVLQTLIQNMYSHL